MLDTIPHVPYRTVMNTPTLANSMSTLFAPPAAAAVRADCAWAWYYDFTEARLEFWEVFTH